MDDYREPEDDDLFDFFWAGAEQAAFATPPEITDELLKQWWDEVAHYEPTFEQFQLVLCDPPYDEEPFNPYSVEGVEVQLQRAAEKMIAEIERFLAAC